MSLEYEVKIKIDSIEELERKLQQLGAVLLDEVYEEDFYIDLRPCIDLRARDEALRVRISRSHKLRRVISELTYKGPKLYPHAKIRKEITVSIDDGRKLIEIFKLLGFRYYVVKKHRKIYRYGPYKLFLDRVEGLGDYLEIEVEGVESVDQFLESIRKLISILKVSENFIVKSYLELILERVELIRQDIVGFAGGDSSEKQ